MASLTRFSLTSSSALCRLLINRNAGLVQQHLPKMIIPSTNQQRSIVTTPIRRDIDSAAKYIGAGAATVGVAGAGAGLFNREKKVLINELNFSFQVLEQSSVLLSLPMHEIQV